MTRDEWVRHALAWWPRWLCPTCHAYRPADTIRADGSVWAFCDECGIDAYRGAVPIPQSFDPDPDPSAELPI